MKILLTLLVTTEIKKLKYFMFLWLNFKILYINKYLEENEEEILWLIQLCCEVSKGQLDTMKF